MNDRDEAAHRHLARAELAIEASEREPIMERRTPLLLRAQVEATMAMTEATLSVALENRNLTIEARRSADASTAIEREMPRIRGALGMGR